MSINLDLPTYLDRIGLAGPVAVSAEGLARVQRAQLLAIPFENFDVLLGRGIDADPGAVFRQLVLERRGGYCFQCNTLLGEALGLLGFRARPLMARVLFGGPSWVPPRMHALVHVEVDGRAYIADAGFGAHTPRSPMPLEDGAEVSADGRTWRLARDTEHGWRLTDHAAGGWRDLYVFDLSTVYPTDVQVANHWVSTCDRSPFVNTALVVRHTAAGRRTLLGRRYSVHENGHSEQRDLAGADDLARVTTGDLGIPLDLGAAEWSALWERIPPPQGPADW